MAGTVAFETIQTRHPGDKLGEALGYSSACVPEGISAAAANYSSWRHAGVLMAVLCIIMQMDVQDTGLGEQRRSQRHDFAMTIPCRSQGTKARKRLGKARIMSDTSPSLHTGGNSTGAQG